MEKNFEKIRMNFERSINSFEIQKNRLPDYLLNNYFFLPIS